MVSSSALAERLGVHTKPEGPFYRAEALEGVQYLRSGIPHQGPAVKILTSSHVGRVEIKAYVSRAQFPEGNVWEVHEGDLAGRGVYHEGVGGVLIIFEKQTED